MALQGLPHLVALLWTPSDSFMFNLRRDSEVNPIHTFSRNGAKPEIWNNEKFSHFATYLILFYLADGRSLVRIEAERAVWRK